MSDECQPFLLTKSRIDMTDVLGMCDEGQSICSHQVLKRRLRCCLYFADCVVACVPLGPFRLCLYVSDRFNHPEQVYSERPDKNRHPVPPDREWGIRLTTLDRKNDSLQKPKLW